MGTGIRICGLNGCGKSTLGRALAERIGFHFIDNESLYFPGTNPADPYANPNSRETVEKLLLEEVSRHPDFVFAAVKGDYGKAMIPLYNCIVVMEVPKSIRSRRIRNRAFQKFGNRMLEGGDLYRQQEAFFQMAESRADDFVESWLQTMHCPIIRVDGTKPVEENVAYVIQAMNLSIPVSHSSQKRTCTPP